MIVYLITNLVDNKKYIGITQRKLKVRWYEHVKKSKQSNLSILSLHYAINLYGKENFKLEVLRDCVTLDELCLYECKYILEFSTMDCGYNMNSGGSCYKVSEKTKKLSSILSNSSRVVNVYKDGIFSNRYRSVNETGRVLKIDVRKIFRILAGKRKTSSGYSFSYLYSESIDLIDNKFTLIYKYDLLGNFIKKYDSISQCSIENNIDKSWIGKVIKSKKYYIKGDYYFDGENINFDFNLKRRLYQYNHNGEVIDIFSSIGVASVKTGISRTSISMIISKKRKNKNCYFIWE